MGDAMPLEFQPVSWYPGLTDAVNVTCCPGLYQPLPGETVPAPAKLTATVR